MTIGKWYWSSHYLAIYCRSLGAAPVNISDCLRKLKGVNADVNYKKSVRKRDMYVGEKVLVILQTSSNVLLLQ